jgi:hypothetical protein
MAHDDWPPAAKVMIDGPVHPLLFEEYDWGADPE